MNDDGTLADFRLSAGARRTLGPLARIVCTDEIESLGLTCAVLDHYELSLRSFPAYLRLGLVVGCWLFEWVAVLLPSSRGSRFSSLTRAQQDAYFRRWWSHPVFAIRQIAAGMKRLLALAYWDHPTVRARLEYHPERWIAEVAARRLRDYGDEVKRQDQMVLEPNPLVTPRALTRKVNRDQTS
jgi:hypothetical protein